MLLFLSGNFQSWNFNNYIAFQISHYHGLNRCIVILILCVCMMTFKAMLHINTYINYWIQPICFPSLTVRIMKHQQFS